MLRRPMLAVVPVLACTVLLAGCGDDNAGKGKGRAAASQVLEGSVSDAMLPLDEVQSQSPLAPPEPEKAPTSILSRDAAPGGGATPGGADEGAGTAEGGASTEAPLIPAAPKSDAPAAQKPAAPKPAAPKPAAAKPAAPKSADPIGAAVEAGSRNR